MDGPADGLLGRLVGKPVEGLLGGPVGRLLAGPTGRLLVGPTGGLLGGPANGLKAYGLGLKRSPRPGPS